jgi:hypothetical protein
VRRAARRQGKRRDTQEQDEQQGEALLLEELDDAPERFLAVALQPTLELVAGRATRIELRSGVSARMIGLAYRPIIRV